MPPDLVVLGNLLVDDVVFPDGRTRMSEPGGAALYAALGARLWDLSVGVVSWRGTDYPAAALEALARRGVALDGVHELGRPGLRTWLLYEGARRRVVHRLDSPSHAEVSPLPDRIPPAWLRARAFYLAPMPLEIQRGLVSALSGLDGAVVAVDPHVPVRLDTLGTWADVLASADALFSSEDEVLLPEPDVERALRSLRRPGGRLRHVVFKRGARGGTLFDVAAERAVPWRPRVADVVDPTGAGDAFAAGVIAGWLRGEPHERALGRGVVSASFAIEGWGPAGLLAASPEAAAARLRDWFGEA